MNDPRDHDSLRFLLDHPQPVKPSEGSLLGNDGNPASLHAALPSEDSQELWKAAYRFLEQNVISSQMEAWFQHLRLIGTQDTGEALQVVLAVGNEFSANWILSRYKQTLENAFLQVTGKPCQIQVEIRPDEKVSTLTPAVQEWSRKNDLQRDSQARSSREDRSRDQAREMREGREVRDLRDLKDERSFEEGRRSDSTQEERRSAVESSIDPRYTFDSFVVGASNQFAHASAIAVAEQPARQYNPLFLYGPPGLGKTHLLHAIGNHYLRNHPSGRVGYLSAERFVNELVESLQKFRMGQFRAKYRDSYDLLLIDDIQFIAKKSASEEEFFHTFNALHGSKRQIVVTSDRPPKEIDGLEERIRTRFEWGLIADICPPEIETRIAILRAKAERDDIYLPEDVATFLASYIKSNVRELEGVLIRLQAQASLTGAEISLEMAKQELKISIPEEGNGFTVEAIQNAVAKKFEIKVQDLKSTSRARQVALPRQIGMYLARKYTGLGYREIGLFFGGKDHTTVLHGCKKIEEDMELSTEVRELVESIQNLL